MNDFLQTYGLSWSIVGYAAVGGALWCFAYVLYIRRGFIDKMHGVPRFIIMGNFAWEVQSTFILRVNILQTTVNAAWLLLNSLIVYQLVRFGKPNFARQTGFPERWFYPWFAVVFIIQFMLFLTISIETNDPYGHYSSYTLNLYIAFLFLQRLVAEKEIRGQSLYAGVMRQFGTGIYALAGNEFLGFRPYLITVYISTFVVDGIYNVLLYRELKSRGIDPWRRF